MPKIPSLPAATTLDDADLIVVEDTSVGTTKSSTLAVIKAFLGITDKRKAGWTLMPATPLYVSATSIKFTGVDYTSIFEIGDKIMFDNSSTKYFYVVGKVFSTDTTLTLTAGNVYTVANSAITNAYFSKEVSPVGHPIWFNYTPTFSAISPMTWTSVTATVAQFCIIARRVKVDLDASGTTGGSASNNLQATVPVDRIGTTAYSSAGYGLIVDGSDSAATAIWDSTSQSRVNMEKYNAANLALAGGRRFMGAFDYAI